MRVFNCLAGFASGHSEGPSILTCQQTPQALLSQTRVVSHGEMKWKAQIAAWRSELQSGGHDVRRAFERLKKPIRGLRVTERVQEILNVVTATKLKGSESKSHQSILSSIKYTIVDVSQNPVRRAFTGDSGFCHTLCTSSLLVHLGYQRMVLPAEHMAFQGHNLKRLKFGQLTHSKIRELAGEGIFLPSLATVIWCMHLVGTFQ